MRIQRMQSWLVLALLVAMGGIVATRWAGVTRAAAAGQEFPDEYFFNAHDDPDQKTLNELVGKKMPELSVADWTNGEVKPADMKGKVVVLDIWATWCGPCVRAIPHNNEMTSKYKDKGLVIIGICSDGRGQDKLGEAIEKYKIAYPVCKDPDLKTEKEYHLSFYPTYVAVDKKGIVRAIGLQPEHVEDVVKKLLDEKAE